MQDATDEAVIETIRQEVARRKGTVEPAQKPVLRKAADAVERAKAKHLRARKWPRFLRPLRRDQEAINEALITAVQVLVEETASLSRLATPLWIQHSRVVTQAQQTMEYQRALGERLHALETLEKAPPVPTPDVDAFYTAFEEVFRGSSDLIRQRLREDYQPRLEGLKARFPAVRALDLGCGRGEWLEQLKENGIEARGVDLNERMVRHCTRTGLRATKADGLEYLRAQPAESLELVSGFHIVEHLEFPVLLALLAEIHRVLAPGGLAIFETPNPECPRVATYTFYLDPTHRNPVPMELLSFIATHTGFAATQTERLHLYCEPGKPQTFGDYAAFFTK